jgi:hypothetical protein
VARTRSASARCRARGSSSANPLFRAAAGAGSADAGGGAGTGETAGSRYGSRWNGYVGSSTGRPGTFTAVQSTGAPCVHARAAARRNRSGPPSPRWRVATAAPATSAASRKSARPGTSTGCALHSMNNRWPAAISVRTARSKRTGERRFANQ